MYREAAATHGIPLTLGLKAEVTDGERSDAGCCVVTMAGEGLRGKTGLSLDEELIRGAVQADGSQGDKCELRSSASTERAVLFDALGP